MRDWALKRRIRTRHLIELGGLVIKAGLVELTDDDRAALYGAFLAVAEKLRGEDREKALAIWKQRGRQAFEAEAGINSATRASNTQAERG
ncbi:conjugal transfer protein TraD [Methylocystis sp. H62]|uniref:conjugal transfer protein TraD n=1 Tax=Methylocystis sp. H62 TaxID=2785789 RepID=UPI0018C327DF|nr:conjugal transfer protein TraD [Methylocystis sp. H62]MBG0792283.1 conjugal transfer protein TraD [Methylocystis sp. H62]